MIAASSAGSRSARSPPSCASAAASAVGDDACRPRAPRAPRTSPAGARRAGPEGGGDRVGDRQRIRQRAGAAPLVLVEPPQDDVQGERVAARRLPAPRPSTASSMCSEANSPRRPSGSDPSIGSRCRSSNGCGSPLRTATSSPTWSRVSPRSAATMTSADDRSSHWPSSMMSTIGCCSAAAASRATSPPDSATGLALAVGSASVSCNGSDRSGSTSAGPGPERADHGAEAGQGEARGGRDRGHRERAHPDARAPGPARPAAGTSCRCRARPRAGAAGCGRHHVVEPCVAAGRSAPRPTTGGYRVRRSSILSSRKQNWGFA